MKKIFRYAAIICASVLAVACAEEPQDEPIVVPPTTKDMTFTTAATTPDSRVLFADGEGFAWENADLTNMAVCYNKGEAWAHTRSTSGAINEGTASFTATVDAQSVFAYCYYPYVENGATDATFAYDFAAALTQSEAGKTTNLRLASDVIAIEGEAQNVTAQFHNVGSLLRYFIYDEESDEKVASVALKASAPIAGTYTYDLANAEGVVGGTTSNEVTVTLGTALSLNGITAADKAKSVFMPIVPATSEGVTYVVTTDKNVYEFVSTAAHTWAEGAATEIKLNLAKATKVTPIGGGEGPDTSNATNIIYCFTNMAVQTAYNFPATEGVAATDYYIVDEGEFGNHIFDYTKPYYTTMRMEYLDATTNEAVDWVTLSTRANDNKLDFAYKANSGAERKAIINIYWDDTEEYKVIGTYKKADKSYEEITTADPIMTIVVTQAAGAGTPDPDPDPSGATEIIYKFTYQGIPAIDFNIAANGVTDQDLSWYSVIIGGTDTADASKAPFTQWRYVATDSEGNIVDWLSVRHQNNNRLYLSCNANTAEARTATINLYWDDTAEYKVVGTYKQAAPNHQVLEQITTADPILTLTVSQASGVASPDPEPEPSNATTLYYHFTDKGIGTLSYNIMATGETKGLGWYSCYVNGQDTADGNLPAFKNWRMEAVDANGNVVDWVTASPFSNTINMTCAANKGAARSATVNFYWDDTEEIVVIGTIKTADRKPYDIASGNFTSADPILTITVNQEGKSLEPTTLYYHFTDKGIGALNHDFSAAGQNNKNLGWYSCYIGGKDNGDGKNDCFQKWISKAYDADGNEVDWVYATPVPNKNEIYLSCAANAGEARAATVKLYWVDNEDFVVIGTVRTADRVGLDIEHGTFTSVDPILELTVNQAAGN